MYIAYAVVMVSDVRYASLQFIRRRLLMYMRHLIYSDCEIKSSDFSQLRFLGSKQTQLSQITTAVDILKEPSTLEFRSCLISTELKYSVLLYITSNL